jgi:hypothetical protein
MKNLITKRITNKLWKILLPAVILLLPVACSVSQFVPAAGAESENRYAIIRTDTLMIVIKPQSYPGSYQEINNRFFSLYISIKNKSGQRIKLQQGSFSILCSQKQYDPIPVDYILADLERKMMLKDISNPFADNVFSYNIAERDKEQEMYYELVNTAFPWGELLPGGIKDGYLFYNKDIASANNFVIDVLGHSVTFQKTKG